MATISVVGSSPFLAPIPLGYVIFGQHPRTVFRRRREGRSVMRVEARLLGSASAIDRRNVSTVMEMS
jgi:hypothetical protein